jgi:hypothetical protein
MIPLQSFYFEVTVNQCGPTRYVSTNYSADISSKAETISPSILGIGVCGERSSPTGMPGWGAQSWGYHSDDGKLFTEDDRGRMYGPKYQTGDVIGCGSDVERKNIFFTKNGLPLGEC